MSLPGQTLKLLENQSLARPFAHVPRAPLRLRESADFVTGAALIPRQTLQL
jgi:hypothetical protein